MQVNIDLTIAMPCPGKISMSQAGIDTNKSFVALMVNVMDATGQRVQLTDSLKLIPVSISLCNIDVCQALI